MTRDEFCKYHWEYYLVLERDFLVTERYVTIDLGEDYLYEDSNPEEKSDEEGISEESDPEDNGGEECVSENSNIKYKGNGECFSNEYVKQYQAICSEVDVLMKSICQEINPASKAKKMTEYTKEILEKWPNIVSQKVSIHDKKLMPYMNWKINPKYNAPDWWGPYNKVKHKRIDNYRKANLKNVLNALAGLYIIEQFFVKYIGDRDGDRDVPNDRSCLFEMVDWETRHHVAAKDFYAETDDIISDIFLQVFDK